jgi:hypothetical protein
MPARHLTLEFGWSRQIIPREIVFTRAGIEDREGIGAGLSPENLSFAVA